MVMLQEAEVYFNPLTTTNNAKSAGVNVKIGKPIDPFVISVMKEVGFNLENNYRKLASKDLVNDADLIISFKPSDELPELIRSHKKIRYWTVPDPQHQSIEFHREVRDAINIRVKELVEEIG